MCAHAVVFEGRGLNAGLMNAEVEQLVSEVRRVRELTKSARKIRADAGLTQQRLADALGVDRTTLARWETGATRPHPAQLKRWTEILDALRLEEAS